MTMIYLIIKLKLILKAYKEKIMFKRSANVNKYANAYFYLINNYSTARAIYLKNTIYKDDPYLEDPISMELVYNINELLDKVVDLTEYRKKVGTIKTSH